MSCPPLNLACLHSYLKSKNFDVKIFDLNAEAFHEANREKKQKYWSIDSDTLWHNEDSFTKAVPETKFKEWKKRISSLKPDLVGFSLYNTNCATSLKLAAALKTNSTKIVLGGPYCRSENNIALDLIKHNIIDAVVIGEGEETLAEIAGNYRDQKVRPCAGAFIKINGQIIDGGNRPPITDIDHLPFPDFSDITLSDYPPIIPILGSRGCINRCAFCNDYGFWGKYRYRSAESIFNEIQSQIRSYNIKNFFFCDLLINGNLKELEKLCLKLFLFRVKEGINITWSAYASVRKMSDSLIINMRLAGCSSLFFGIENGSSKNLELVRKKIDLAYTESLLRKIHHKGIRVHVGWIIGFPGETQKSFMKTVSFAKKIRPNVNGFNLANPLIIHPGCDIWERPHAYGIKSVHPTDWKTWDDGINSQHTRNKWLKYFNVKIGAYYKNKKYLPGTNLTANKMKDKL